MFSCSYIHWLARGTALTFLLPRLISKPGIHSRSRVGLPPLTTAWADCLRWLFSCKPELEAEGIVIGLDHLQDAGGFCMPCVHLCLEMHILLKLGLCCDEGDSATGDPTRMTLSTLHKPAPVQD